MIELKHINFKDDILFTDVFVDEDDWQQIINNKYQKLFLRIVDKHAPQPNTPTNVNYVKADQIIGFRYADNH